MNKKTTINTILINEKLTNSAKLIFIFLTEKLVINFVSKDFFKLNKSQIQKELNISKKAFNEGFTQLINNNLYNPEEKEL